MYPASDYDRPATIAGTLGSFWADFYAAADEARAWCTAHGRAFRRAAADVAEADAALRYDTVPVRHVEEWTAVTVRDTDRVAAVPAVGTYDLGTGHAVGEQGAPVWEVPVAWDAAAALFDAQVGPTRAWLPGAGFTVSDGRLRLPFDPFEAVPAAIEPVFGLNESDFGREVTLWAYRARSDRHWPSLLWGQTIGLDAPSTAGWRDLLAALLRAIVGGTAEADVAAALGAIFGVRTPRVAGVVEHVGRHLAQSLVVTDGEALRFPPGAVPVVAVGDRVVPGQALTTALRVDPLGPGVPAGLAWAAVADGLYAENTDVPLTAFVRNGHTFVRWELQGRPEAATAYFEEAHARGLARGRTLADCLDARPPGALGPARPEHLPAAINPLGFHLANVVQGRALLARVDLAGTDAAAPGAAALSWLRAVLPPETALVVHAEAPGLDGPYAPDHGGDQAGRWVPAADLAGAHRAAAGLAWATATAPCPAV